MKRFLQLFIAAMLLTSFLNAQDIQENTYTFIKAEEKISVDGSANESFWAKAEWASLSKRQDSESQDMDWSETDFSARFKAAWHPEDGFYFYVEVNDDTFLDWQSVKDTWTEAEGPAAHLGEVIEIGLRKGVRPELEDEYGDNACLYNDQTFLFRFNPLERFEGGRPGFGWGAGIDFWAGANFNFKALQSSNGWITEVHIPLTHYQADSANYTNPSGGDIVTFDIIISDADQMPEDNPVYKAMAFNNTYNWDNWDKPCYWGKGILFEEIVDNSGIQKNSYSFGEITTDVTIDGLADESFWNSVPVATLAKRQDSESQDMNWSEDDFSAEFKAVWHKTNGFYFFIDVTDDTFIEWQAVKDSWTEEEGPAAHLGEVIEIGLRKGIRPQLVDEYGDNACLYDDQTFLFRFNPLERFEGGRPGFGWGAGADFWAGANFNFKAIQTAKGWAAEVNIPLSHYKVDAANYKDPETGDIVTFDIIISDADQMPEENSVYKAMAFNNTYNWDNWDKPCYWGQGILSAKTSSEKYSEKIFTVYPNPVNNVLNIRGAEKISKIQIVDINGRVVLTRETEFEQIDVSAIQKGVYLMNIISKEGNHHSVRLVK